ncbi:PREDICTED: uncharacterized protein LOC105599136 isoform X2 [Cercocebus atys]|nr:PREDICTED: uncharacterized protein LOC105599136 isoform X2 [Cercocebus atys]
MKPPPSHPNSSETRATGAQEQHRCQHLLNIWLQAAIEAPTRWRSRVGIGPGAGPWVEPAGLEEGRRLPVFRTQSPKKPSAPRERIHGTQETPR